MRALTQVDCLALWESGQELHPIDQGLLAVQAAFPETRDESVADWPLGRRNRALAELYCATFGTKLSGWTSCRQCGEKLEFAADGKAMAQTTLDDPAAVVSVRGLSFRLPTSRDLARVAVECEERDAAAQLLNLCRVPQEAAEVDAGSMGWSEEELELIGSRLAQADPLAEILLDFQCPVCEESFEESLDLASFFWSELEGRARRLLLDVHTLASAYGWSEAEILALSARRRNFYLKQVEA
ncbi:MAG: hypothetical protein ABSF70_06180 [Terracidiphilus sp.]|jgi:hypothetical protein